MKALSIQEPWASLIKEKVKFIETRSFKTNYRGELYIHASKRKITNSEFDLYNEQISLLKYKDFDYGCIIAKVNLIDCVYMDGDFVKEIKKNHNEFICGSYKVGRYAWILSDIEVVEPLFKKGNLGIWNF